MSIEINQERLSELSIADLYAMYEFSKMYKTDYCYRPSEEDDWNHVMYYTKEEIKKRVNNVFIF